MRQKPLQKLTPLMVWVSQKPLSWYLLPLMRESESERENINNPPTATVKYYAQINNCHTRLPIPPLFFLHFCNWWNIKNLLRSLENPLFKNCSSLFVQSVCWRTVYLSGGRERIPDRMSLLLTLWARRSVVKHPRPPTTKHVVTRKTLAPLPIPKMG